MIKFDIFFISSILTLSMIGCVPPTLNTDSRTNDAANRPNVKVSMTFPMFVSNKNESPISASFLNVDPTWVLGSLINIKNSQIMPFEEPFLSNSAQPKITLLSEIVFKNFVENSLTQSADWLSFVKALTGEDTKAEISVTKVSITTINKKDVDINKIKKFAAKIPYENRNNYGVIIGYIDFALSASFFHDSTAEGKLGAYGAQIGGKWFNKVEASAVDHRLIAIWAPLPFIKSAVEEQNINTPLFEQVKQAIYSNTINVKKLGTLKIEPSQLWYVTNPREKEDLSQRP